MKKINFDAIPDELKRQNQWLNWKYEAKEGKQTKIPKNPGTLENAASNNPKTWGNFEQACKNINRTDGIGFVVTAQDNFTGIDFDHCVNPQNGKIEAWAKELISKIKSYTEISPSGKGIRIFVKAKLPENGRRKQGNIEAYDKGRYLTVTGHVLNGNNTITEWDGAKLHSVLFGTSEDAILKRMFESRNGAAIQQLYKGDFSGYPSHSEADMALCSHLWFWSGSRTDVDRLFRLSGLYRPDKWDRKHHSNGKTYGEGTLDKACAGETWANGKADIPEKEPNPDLLSSLLKWNDIFLLDVKTEYLLEHTIPKGSITLLFGRGGIGKTSLMMQIGRTIAGGLSFGELKTIMSPVYYIDFENPLAVLKERVEKIGQAENIFVWHISNEIQPPKLDSTGWELYKQLPPGLIIFDTLRASHLSDENDSKPMSAIMGRLKALREIGFTILLLHHTPKGNDNTFKGSTALLDLCDHVLGLEEVKDTESENIEFDCQNLYKLATRIKTRYEPHSIYLTFNPEIKGFSVATDPDLEKMEGIHGILCHASEPMNQKQIISRAIESLDLTDKDVRRLLRKGTSVHWTMTKGKQNASLYSVINSVWPFVGSIYTRQTAKQEAELPPNNRLSNGAQSLDTPVFDSLSGGVCQTGKQAEITPPNGDKKSGSLSANILDLSGPDFEVKL